MGGSRGCAWVQAHQCSVGVPNGIRAHSGAGIKHAAIARRKDGTPVCVRKKKQQCYRLAAFRMRDSVVRDCCTASTFAPGISSCHDPVGTRIRSFCFIGFAPLSCTLGGHASVAITAEFSSRSTLPGWLMTIHMQWRPMRKRLRERGPMCT